MSTPDRIQWFIRHSRRRARWRLSEFRSWLEHTSNLLHLVVVLFVPSLLAFVTWLANVTPVISFLVYPPLASGTYTLFADPESEYASPRKFVGGMTVGALCGWVALAYAPRLLSSTAATGVQAEATALSIFLTGLCTWLLDLEVPTAFSTALLVLVSDVDTPVFVAGIVVSSAVVAGAYTVWYDLFYEHRAEYLYQTVKGDDHVLVPIHDEGDDETALFAAYIAAAHDAGKLVLFDAIEDPAESDPDSDSGRARADGGAQLTTTTFDTGGGGSRSMEVPEPVVDRLTTIEEYVESTMELPCEMVVTRGDSDNPRLPIKTARQVNCDLIVSSCPDSENGSIEPSSYVQGILGGPIDSVAFDSAERQTSWSRILVMVHGGGHTAHAMVDFAQRLAPRPRTITLCTCLSDKGDRHSAESVLDDLASSFSSRFETRVSYNTVPEYLATTSSRYDLVVIGASTGRSRASRLVSPPTVEQLDTVECDLAVVHSGR